MTEEEFDPLSIFKNLFQKKKEQQNNDAAGKQSQSAALRKFLDWMERLDHSERIRRVIELGKESISADAASADYAKSLLIELSKGHFYEKQLALMSCWTSKDKAMILHFCSDSSQKLRKLGNSLAMLYCEDSAVLNILSEAKKNERVKLLAQLKKNSRASTVDLFLEKLKEENHDDLYSLVYFGSTEFVKKSLAEVQERMSSADATRFAYAHPELCVQFLKDYAKTCSREDPRLFSLFWGASKWISEFCPDSTIELIDELLPLYAAQKIVPLNLMYLRPAKIVSTLKKQAEYGGADFRPILSKLPDATVLELANQRQIANSITSKFDRLSPALRTSVFEKCSESWRNADGAIAASLIELLPAKQRIQQARINLSLANLATKPELQMNYLRLLEFDELKASIKDAISNPDLDSRGQAFFALVYSLKFNRDKLGEALDLLHQRKNEPDPVREKFLSALSFLPPSMFKENSLPQLDLLIEDALSAQDLSYGSLSAIGKSLLRLFPFHKSWVRDHLKKLLRDRSVSMITAHPCRLLDDDAKYLSVILKEVIDYWELKEREGEIVQLGNWLRLRLESCEPVVAALRNLAKSAKAPYTSESAARLLSEWLPKEFDSLVPELLKLDQSWATKPLIYKHLSEKRQSLLTPYLGQNSYKGRFSTGKTRTVPAFETGFHKWTEKQQKTYAHELSQLAIQASSNYGDRIFGIRRLCLLPEPDIEVLQNLSSVENKEIALRDFCIRQMAETDNGCAAPLLIACLNDERATQAIYALRYALLQMKPETALELIKQVPRKKITIFKELLRLAGDTKTPQAFDWLLELESSELHRDVRSALLRALWNYPERQETWNILRKTVAIGDPVFVDTAIRIPAWSLSTSARASLLHLYNDALACADPKTRLKTLNQISMSPMLDPQQILASALKTCILSEAQDECRAACDTAAALYAGRDMDVLNIFLESLVELPRNLRTYIQIIQARFIRQREIFAKDCRKICAFLDRNPNLFELSLSLSGSVLPWLEFYERLKELDNNRQLHFGIIQTAIQTFNQQGRDSELADLEKVEHLLREDKSENLRRLGLAALCAVAGSPSAWSTDRLAVLRAYRKDTALLVSSAAIFTLPAAELLSASQPKT